VGSSGRCFNEFGEKGGGGESIAEFKNIVV